METNQENNDLDQNNIDKSNLNQQKPCINNSGTTHHSSITTTHNNASITIPNRFNSTGKGIKMSYFHTILFCIFIIYVLNPPPGVSCRAGGVVNKAPYTSTGGGGHGGSIDGFGGSGGGGGRGGSISGGIGSGGSQSHRYSNITRYYYNSTYNLPPQTPLIYINLISGARENKKNNNEDNGDGSHDTSPSSTTMMVMESSDNSGVYKEGYPVSSTEQQQQHQQQQFVNVTIPPSPSVPKVRGYVSRFTIEELLENRFQKRISNDIFMDPCKAGGRGEEGVVLVVR